MKFIQKKKILENLSAFVWRVEYHKRGLPHAHLLFWIYFDPQGVSAVERAIVQRFAFS
jgi:hypothetical protein